MLKLTNNNAATNAYHPCQQFKYELSIKQLSSLSPGYITHMSRLENLKMNAELLICFIDFLRTSLEQYSDWLIHSTSLHMPQSITSPHHVSH